MTEETLFHEALSKPSADRAAFLEEKCVGNPSLRAAVEALLAAHEAPGSFLNRPANPLAQTVDSEPGPVHQGATGEFTPEPDKTHNATSNDRPKADASQVIAGRYTLLQKIGEGGMGEVWVAQQTEPVKRKVALKLIKTGMDSKRVLARFEQERQALAIMDHPNIARVLDGGMTPTGQPFFVMELVNGLALTKFCDEARLTPRQRLELFIPICQAVQHAHQKGIVHRDLKPANILVTMIDGKPVPKVIDFGVAKATGANLTDEAMNTQFGAVVGTLEYMAPEQAGFSGVDIDTRADIYSLGVILYELLTGLRPIDSKRLKKAALAEMIRIIQEDEPSRPSTRLSTEEALPSLAAVRQTDPRKLMAELRGELDWVVMKCLEKQRDRRYETANALARDIQRYLTDEPVEARPPSVGYRLQKMLRRNRVVVLAVAAMAASLLLGLGLAIWQAVVATEARNDALTAERLERKARGEAVNLANEKAKLADTNAKLAEDESKAKNEAKKLAERNAKLADDESNARKEADRQLLRTRSILFTGQMDRAREIREKDPRQAFNMLYDLGKCPAEFRDLSWNYSVHALRHQLVASVQMPSGSYLAPLAWSPKGDLFATLSSGGGRNHVSLFEVETGKVRATFPERVLCPDYSSLLLAFSPDGSKLAVTADGSSTLRPKGALIPEDATSLAPGTVQIWDVERVKKIATLEGHTDAVLALTFSPDSMLLATGSLDNTARIWDLKTAKEKHVFKEHAKEVGAISFSPDGKRLATGGGDDTIKLWDVEGFKLRNTWAIAPGPASPEIREKVNPDAEKPLVTQKEIHGIRLLQFSPDGAILASSCASQPLEFRNVTTGVVYLTNRDLKTPLLSLVFHRDGQSVLTTSTDDKWKAQLFTLTGRLLRVFPGGLVEGSGFRRERNLIATRFGDLCEIWDLDLPLEPATITLDQAVNSPPPTAFGLRGEVLAVGEQERIILHDVRTGKVRQTLTGHKGRVTALALSPDGRTLASFGGELRLWDFTTGKPLGTIEIKSAVTSLAFSPDGSTLALWHQVFFGQVPVVSLWDVTARKSLGILEFPKGETYVVFAAQQGTIAFNPADGRLVTAVGHSLMIWNTKTRAIEQHILTKSADAKFGGSRFYDMAISPDGKSIATLGVLPPTMSELALWDPHTGKPIAKTPLRPKFDSAVRQRSVAFSPSGRELITCVGGEIQFWDVLSLQERGTIQDAGNPYQKPMMGANRSSTPRWSHAILSPDGRVLATLPNLSPSGPGNDPKKPAQIELWDLSRPEVLLKLPVTATMLFSRDSKTLIENRTDGLIRFWDLGTGSVLTEVNTTHQAIGSVLSPDGWYLVGTDFEGPEEEAKRYRTFGRTGNDRNDQKQGTFNGYITLWDIQTRKLRRIDIGKGGFRFPPIHSPVGNSLAFVRDASLGDKVDIAVEVWDLAQERMTIRFALPQVHRLDLISTFSPDGNTFAVRLAGFVRLFDLQNKSELDPLPVPDKSGATKISFTKDSKRLVLRQELGITKRQTMWDWRTGKQVNEPIPDLFDGPRTSPDGRYELIPSSGSLEWGVIDRLAKPAVPRRR